MSNHKYGYIVKELPIGSVERDPNQPRKDFGTDGDTNRLLVSIQQNGIEEFIKVSEYEPGKYIILDGHRRYICAKKLGFAHVPCRVYPKMSSEEFELRRYEMQNNRRDWRPGERAEAIERIRNNGTFSSNKQLADTMHISESTVANSLLIRRQHVEYLSLMERYGLPQSYRVEIVKLKGKLRRIGDYEVDDIIINLFERVQNKVITNSKDFRALKRIFRRGTGNAAEIIRYLDNPEMTVYELEQRTLQSGFSLHIEELINDIAHKRQNGIKFSQQETLFMQQLREIL